MRSIWKMRQSLYSSHSKYTFFTNCLVTKFDQRCVRTAEKDNTHSDRSRTTLSSSVHFHRSYQEPADDNVMSNILWTSQKHFIAIFCTLRSERGSLEVRSQHGPLHSRRRCGFDYAWDRDAWAVRVFQDRNSDQILIVRQLQPRASAVVAKSTQTIYWLR